MTPIELVLGTAAYLLSSLSLGLASWALAEVALPRPARLGLRLLTVLAGQLVLCAILVQTLGLFGVLRIPWYLACSLAPGIAVLWLWREKRPLEKFFRLFQQTFRLWIAAPAWGLGWLGALSLLYLAKRGFFLPRDIDALTLHAPLIAEWVSSGRVSLTSFWHYPQVWEYVFVPSFLLLRSDVLVVIPSLLGILAFVLAFRELAARLGLGGGIGHLLALLVASMPTLWREPLKNDPIFGLALLLGMLAIDRASRRRRGHFWLLQLAVFLVLGTKPTGFLYAGALGGVYLAVFGLRSRGPSLRTRVRTLVPALLFTLLFQASACAVQLRNFQVNRSPVHPLRFEMFGREIFPGPGDLSGTSILDNASQPEVWRQFVLGGSLTVGPEWPLLLLLLAAALIWALYSGGRLLAARRRPRPGAALGLVLPPVVLLLWALFVATPWSCGLRLGAWQYLAGGTSLRYAIAPLALTYLLAAAMARRLLGRRPLFVVLAGALPLLFFAKWSYLGYFGDTRFFLWKLFSVWVVVIGLHEALSRWRLVARAGPHMKMAASFLLLLAISVLFARWAEGIRATDWVKSYRAIWSQIYDQVPPGSTIATNDGMASFRYFLHGRRYENRIVVIKLGDGQGGQIPDDVSYFYLFAPRGHGQRLRLIEIMNRRGWRLFAMPEDDRNTALLVRP